MASWDSLAEDDCKIVPLELPNPEDTQICWKGQNELLSSRQHLILQFLLVIGAFIWQAQFECYGNGLIDVEEKPQIPKHFWQGSSRVSSCYPKQP